MRRTFAWVTVATLLVGTRVSAQLATVGTVPGVDTSWWYTADVDWVSQSFVSTGDYLDKLAFWYHGGQYDPSGTLGDGQHSRLIVSSGASVNPFDGEIYRQVLDQGTRGRYDIRFEYLPLARGHTYRFSIFTINCGVFGVDPCGLAEYAQPLGKDGPSAPSIEFTLSDAYADGVMYAGRSGIRSENDLRFEATFVSVPEPGTFLLLLTGLTGFGVLVLRRRRA